MLPPPLATSWVGQRYPICPLVPSSVLIIVKVFGFGQQFARALLSGNPWRARAWLRAWSMASCPFLARPTYPPSTRAKSSISGFPEKPRSGRAINLTRIDRPATRTGSMVRQA
jgi:hypothetical protein